VTYVHDETSGCSYLGVWDAATMGDAPLARVALPARVPYGFHALWAGAAALKQEQLVRAR
jgi:carotenoid cleavage dioxygenase-like enzyme